MALDRVRLGVDFGTSNTVAVVRWPDGRARPLLFDGSPLLPSSVYAEPDGTLLVGRDAVHSARLEPARFEPNPKRRIDDGVVLLGDRELPVGELITAVLARVAEERRRATGDVPADVTLTCPASWGATRRLVLADAAAAADLGTVRLVAEPVAAATYFTKVLGRDVPIGSVVVVHDFGAGTFDASVVARTAEGFAVLAVDGRDDIGGLDVDEALVGRIGEICRERNPAAWQRLMAPTTVEERRARRLLWDDARVAKERLSRSTTADVTVPLLDTEVHLTREELEELARPLLDQTVRVTAGVMRWARLAEGRLAGVFLVGGSSRIPLMATLLHRSLGEAPVAIEQPELVVAEGSMLASEQVAPAAAPAPGPATGPLPMVPAAAAAGGPVPAAPVSGAPAPGAVTPVSGGPAVAPVSGGSASPMASAVASVPGGSVPGGSVPGVAQASGGPVSGGIGKAGAAAGRPEPETAVVPWVGRAAVPMSPAPPVPVSPPSPPVAVAQVRPVAPTRTMPRYDGRAPAPGRYGGVEPPRSLPGAPGPWDAGAGRAVPVAIDLDQDRRAAEYRTRSGSGGWLSRFMIFLFLALVPLVSGYLTFKATVGESPLPLDLGGFLRAVARLAR